MEDFGWVPHLDKFEAQGYQGQKRHFSAVSAVYVW